MRDTVPIEVTYHNGVPTVIAVGIVVVLFLVAVALCLLMADILLTHMKERRK